MSDITIFGAGAFGTALAISLARGGKAVSLVTRSKADADKMISAGENQNRLPGHQFPKNLKITSDTDNAANLCLVTVPMQKLADFLNTHAANLGNRTIVACCKGVDLKTGHGPTKLIALACPTSTPAMLSGPGFAVDIAAGMPTAMTVALDDDATGKMVQTALSNDVLRIYRSTDIAGVELGGALKNVIAISSGVTIGANLGESARAALITRGFAEISRFAGTYGAKPETLVGLSGLGDLVLTATSEKSRNYAFGMGLAKGLKSDTDVTVEGAATAVAVSGLAKARGIEMPITDAVSQLVQGRISAGDAIKSLLSRPLKEE